MSTENKKFLPQLENGLRIAFPAILAFFVIFNGVSFVLAGQDRLIDIFDDDAYYYFTIARNLIQEGRLTFDGTTLTNGFQPLWFGLLLPIFSVFQDPLTALRAVGILNTLLAGLAGLPGLVGPQKVLPHPIHLWDGADAVLPGVIWYHRDGNRHPLIAPDGVPADYRKNPALETG